MGLFRWVEKRLIMPEFDGQNIYRMIPDAWEKFTFVNYFHDEQNILKPALEKLGYSNIQFFMGERDSFGPLSRIIRATKNGIEYEWIYG